MASSAAWQALQNLVQNKNVLVFGLGLQGGGVGVANTLVQAGAIVRATDSKTAEELAASIAQLDSSIQGTYGQHTDADIAWADIILKNPAVPYTQPLITAATSQGKTVTTEAALTLQCARDRTIGITGTRGKTTTTTLIHHILHTNNFPVALCGNIPEKPTLAALATASDDTFFVMEISSFQVESFVLLKLSPRYAIVTNVFPDHLNRYASLEEYARTKAQLFAFQQPGDQAFWGTQHEWTQLLENTVGSGVGKHPISPEQITRAKQYRTTLPGQHNLENIALAAEVARSLGIGESGIASAVASFTGVPYRLQKVGEKGGLTFINDTTATTPVALERALAAQTQPYILLCGGTTKNLPFPPALLNALRTQPRGIVWLKGSGTTELQHALAPLALPQTEAGTLAEAFAQSVSLAKQTSAPCILFSPGFTSFELFKNEFDRGDQFNTLVTTWTV